MDRKTRREIVATLVKQGRKDLASNFVRAALSTKLQDKIDAAYEEFWKEVIPSLEKVQTGQYGPFKSAKFAPKGSWLDFQLVANDGTKVKGAAIIRNGKLLVSANDAKFTWDHAHNFNVDQFGSFIGRIMRQAIGTV